MAVHQGEVRWTMTDRGFKHYAPIKTPSGTTITIYESSAASGPHLWVDGDLGREHLTLEEAAELRDRPGIDGMLRATLAVAIERHYQMPQPDPKDWKAGDPCAMCGSTDTGEDEGAAFCRSCGADDRDA